MKTIYYIHDCTYPTKAIFSDNLLGRIEYFP